MPNLSLRMWKCRSTQQSGHVERGYFEGRMGAMKTNFLGAVATLALLSSAYPCTAAVITYEVSRTIGAGSVTGFIETDGTIGVLNTSNILDWNLKLNNGTNTFDLLGPLSGSNSAEQVVGADLSATATQLLFDFSGGDGYMILQAPTLFSGFNFWCAQGGTSIQCSNEPPGGTEIVNVFPAAANQFTDLSGTIALGTTGVPEPASWALLILGFAGVGFAGYRRSKEQVSFPIGMIGGRGAM
jgi:hypothetical protein